MRRDSSGRSQVSAPLTDNDVVNYQWAEGRYARVTHTHPEITGAATTPTANAIPKYTSNSRLTSANPNAGTEVVNYQTMSSWMGGKKMWFGTESQYDAIPTKDVNTVYFLIS